MNDGTLLLRSPDLLTRSFAGEALVAAPTRGDIERFTASAAAVWDLLEAPSTFHELISILANAYDAAENVIARDVESFVGELIERGWVRELQGADD